MLPSAKERNHANTPQNGGHCQPNVYSNPPPTASFELANYTFLKTLIETENIPCNWTTTPGVHALYSPHLVTLAQRNITRLKELDPSLAETVHLATDPSELAGLRLTGAVGAVVQKNAASLWPYRLVTWVMEDLLARFDSLNLQTKTSVVDIQRHGSSWIVHTPRGQICASQVLVACNGYTSRIIPNFTNLIVPVQGHVAALSPEWKDTDPLGNTYVFMSEGEKEMDDYLVQSRTAHLIYGGGRTLGKDKGWGISADDITDPVVASHLRKNLNTVLSPGGEDGGEMRADYEWSGIMGFSADASPWVGQLPPSLVGGGGLFVCGGYTGHGMPNAALSAKAVVAMMGGQDGDLPDAYRVAEGRVARVLSGEKLSVEDYEELVPLI
ncbi:FAD-binding oxidoreductase [Candidatus Bathyarchaeota archaeon]|nr:FAD-binding oxidoreductase [Candidatus Bathyarchaeota archaeon]